VKPDVELGAWIVAAYKVISEYDAEHPAFDSFEALIKAARTGELLSAIRSMGSVDGEKFEKFRKLSRLKPSAAKQVLREAETLGLVEISWSKANSRIADRVRVVTDSKEAVFEAVGKLFPRFEPTSVELATVSLLSATLAIPCPLEGVKSQLASKGYPDQAVRGGQARD
jgi:hypothetical protein